jgi:cleavage and polyadenylation specificity factor subunit 1
MLSQTSKSIELSDVAQQAFEAAKASLCSSVKLNFFSSDPSHQLTLTTDASNAAVGAVLQQLVHGTAQPIAFFSQKLQPAQTRYSTFGRELLAIYLSIRHFRHLLEGRDFIIFTDHKPLVYALHSSPDRHSPRESRHLDYISQFSSDIRYIKGDSNVVADTLSRPGVNIVKPKQPFNITELVAYQHELNPAELSKYKSLKLKSVSLQFDKGSILCDESTGNPRPLVPPSMRRNIFQHFHSISHPGKRATVKLIANRFVWPSMNKDVRSWVQHCIQCQKTKVWRHTITSPGTFSQPDDRFSHVHVDIVGPLPQSNGFSYIFTAIDRFTRWPVAVPINDTCAETVARAFVDNWVANFGAPAAVTTDRGAQFQSALFQSLANLLGCQHIRTTAYHPRSNGLVERFHRQLKVSLTCQPDQTRWTENLPLVLLGIRSTVKEDLQFSPAELVFGSPLCLPGELVDPSRSVSTSTDYISRLRQFLPTLKYTAPRQSNTPEQKSPHLDTCEYVFVRRDSVLKPLQPRYQGPHKVLERAAKYFVLDLNGRRDTVSIDRLKPAFIEIPDKPTPPHDIPNPIIPPPISIPMDPPTPVLPDSPSVTRSGRRVHWPRHLAEYVK